MVVHDWAGVLSVPVAVVSSVRSTSRDRTMLWPTVPANSRSELVMPPFGLSQDTSCDVTLSGNGNRHRVGGSPGGLAFPLALAPSREVLQCRPGVSSDEPDSSCTGERPLRPSWRRTAAAALPFPVVQTGGTGEREGPRDAV